MSFFMWLFDSAEHLVELHADQVQVVERPSLREHSPSAYVEKHCFLHLGQSRLWEPHSGCRIFSQRYQKFKYRSKQDRPVLAGLS